MGDDTGVPPSNFESMLSGFSTQADQMVTAAQEGRFAVSEEAGEALKKAIDDYIDDWTYNQPEFQRLAEKPRLGSSPYAQQVGNHAVLVADGDELSAKTQLDALREVLIRAKEAIETAKTKYRQQDADGANKFKQLHQD